MFPVPIQKRPLINQISYKILIPISLLIWLVPLIGIMLTSIRGLGDISQGNLWGMPSEFLLFSNLKDVFTNTPMSNTGDPLIWTYNVNLSSISVGSDGDYFVSIGGSDLAGNPYQAISGIQNGSKK